MRWLIPLVLGLAFWQGLISVFELPRYILPAPWSVAETLYSSRMLLLEHAGVTLLEVLLGLVLGAILGAATALSLAASPLSMRAVKPLLIMTQAVPVFALAPLLTLWFGYGLTPKVLIALLIIYFPVTSTFLDGLLRTPKDWIHMAQVMGASPRAILLKVRTPAALPAFLSGLKLAAVYAPIGAVIGEWVGASKGLGYLMLLANGRVKTDLMFASIIALMAITLSLYLAMAYAEKRALARFPVVSTDQSRSR